MPDRTDTLPAEFAAELVSAGFRDDDASRVTLDAALRSDSPRARVLALRGLLRRRAFDEALWNDVLADEAPLVLHEVLTQIGFVRPTLSSWHGVIAQLRNDDPLVAEAAAFALGECGVVDALDELRWVLANHEDARCRESAVVALGQLGVDDARPAVITALLDKPTVRRRAVVALSNFEGDEVEAALDRASDDRDWQVRSAVEQLRKDLD